MFSHLIWQIEFAEQVLRNSVFLRAGLVHSEMDLGVLKEQNLSGDFFHCIVTCCEVLVELKIRTSRIHFNLSTIQKGTTFVLPWKVPTQASIGLHQLSDMILVNLQSMSWLSRGLVFLQVDISCLFPTKINRIYLYSSQTFFHLIYRQISFCKCWKMIYTMNSYMYREGWFI